MLRHFLLNTDDRIHPRTGIWVYLHLPYKSTIHVGEHTISHGSPWGKWLDHHGWFIWSTTKPRYHRDLCPLPSTRWSRVVRNKTADWKNVGTAKTIDILLMVQKSGKPVEVGSLSNYLQGFIHPRWCRSSSINRMVGASPLCTCFKHFPQLVVCLDHFSEHSEFQLIVNWWLVWDSTGVPLS